MRKYFLNLLEAYYSFYSFPGAKLTVLSPGDSFPDLKGTDLLVLSGIIHYEDDIQDFLERIKREAPARMRLIIIYYSSAWKPAVRLADMLGLRKLKGKREENWVAPSDMEVFLTLSGFELISTTQKVLIPIYIPLLSDFANRWLAPLPFFRIFTLFNLAVARPAPQRPSTQPSVSIVVAARNESGNLKALFETCPTLGSSTELIIVEGGSTDGTWEKLQEIKGQYLDRYQVVLAKQQGKGKGDAIRKGFSLATKDILMIWDADLTVSGSELHKFYDAIYNGKGEFINGSRLVYPMEDQAMRFFNIIGNKFFATAFSFLLSQAYKDTLCGTKTLYRSDYERIAANRDFFGGLDPFGDFDLIFGASKLGLKVIQLPIHYRERVYGETNISRWTHGFLLLRMVILAARRIRFI